jgi:hypothetical protein
MLHVVVFVCSCGGGCVVVWLCGGGCAVCGVGVIVVGAMPGTDLWIIIDGSTLDRDVGGGGDVDARVCRTIVAGIVTFSVWTAFAATNVREADTREACAVGPHTCSPTNGIIECNPITNAKAPCCVAS